MAIPLLIAGGVAAASAAAKAAAAAAGAGKNRRAAQAFYDPSGKTGYNPNASNWNGKAGGLEEYQRNLHASQMGVEGREAYQANYGRANEWENQSLQARAAQGQAANLMMDRARGAVPSIASQQGALDMQRAQAAQASQAASARGAAGLALAQQNAANNVANAQSQISGQTQINAANERLAAEQAAFGAYSGMRGGDLASQGQSAGQEQFQAQMQQANRQANDQRAMGYEQLKYGSSQGQMNAKMQEQGILAASHNAKEGLQQQTAQANANREGQQVDSIINGISNTANTAGMAAGGGGVGSDERMKIGYRASGGPVLAGKPYVVGEKGPELVIPSASGTVVPNHMLRKGGKALTTREMLDDRARQDELTAPADQGGPSLDSMLDDRARQTSAPSEDTIGREALHTGIENQIVRDRDPLTQAERDQAMIEQWERSTGQTAQQARDEVRTSDNRAEMAKTNARLGVGGKEKPWYMTDVQGLSMTGNAPSRSVSSLDGRSVWAGGNTFESDDRAKLAAAWDQGHNAAMGDVQTLARMPPEKLKALAQTNPLAAVVRATKSAAYSEGQGYTVVDDPSEEKKEKARYDQNLRDAGQREIQGGSASKPTGPVPRIAPIVRPSIPVDRGPLADANRQMRGEPYMYRPEHTPEHEQPGQPHYGFMAQNLEKNPISATAVEEGPDGMKRVDRDRMMQVMASGLSDLQRQQDEMRATLAKGGRKSKAA